MGRFAACLLLLLGACGDNLDVEGLGAGPTDDIQPGGNADNVPRYVPSVCGVQTWTPPIATTNSIDLSVVQRPSGGATLLTVPRAGGEVYGINLDSRMNMETGTKVALDNTYESIVGSYLNGRPVTTSTAAGAVYVHLLDDNLASPQYIAKIPGNHVAEGAFFKAQGNIVLPVVTDSGLWMHRFDDSLEPLDVKQFKATAPGTSITVSQLGTAMVTAWSTASECYMMVNTTYEPGISTRVDRACPDPRLSINQTTGEGVMLFDSAEGIRLMPIQTTMFGGDARVIRADAHSPRTLFDGTNFWVSYIDSRGDVVVGFLDANRHPVTMSLGAPSPERSAYELAFVDGAPTVFSVDETGYSAYRMCVDAQF